MTYADRKRWLERTLMDVERIFADLRVKRHIRYEWLMRIRSAAFEQ